MGRWNKAVEKTGGGIYMDLQPGENKIRVLNDPVVQNKTFDDGPSTIFSWLVWDYATSSVRILSKGSSFLKKFDFYMDTWGDELPMKCDIIIKKEGTGMGTRYEFVPVPVQNEMASNWREQAKAIDLRKALPYCFSMKDYIEKDTGNEARQQEASVVQDMEINALGPREDEEKAPPDRPGVSRIPFSDLVDEPINLDDIPF